jgi:hypothetical protein
MPKKAKRADTQPRQSRELKTSSTLTRVWLKPAPPDDVMAAAPGLARPWILDAMQKGYRPADGVAVVVDAETPLGIEISILREMGSGKTREQASLDLLAEIEDARKVGRHVIKSSWFDNDSFCRLCEEALQPGDERWRTQLDTATPLGHIRLAVVVANAVRFCTFAFDATGGN